MKSDKEINRGTFSGLSREKASIINFDFSLNGWSWLAMTQYFLKADLKDSGDCFLNPEFHMKKVYLSTYSVLKGSMPRVEQ